MANFKKEDKASILARLEVLEKKVETLEKSPKLGYEVPMVGGMGLSFVPALPITSTAGDPVPAVSITSVVTQPPPEVKHKCQTNTCESMETKEYQGKDRKMWLCDTHKF